MQPSWIKHVGQDCPVVSNDTSGNIKIGSYACRLCEHNVGIDTVENKVRCEKLRNHPSIKDKQK